MTTDMQTTQPTEHLPAAKPTTLKAWLSDDRFRHSIAQALPKHLSPDRFLRVATTALTRTPKLAQCDQASFFNCLLTLSQVGLEPDGRHAHLIPFENRKRNCIECQLIIDYKGLVALIMRSGLVSFIHADVVCEADDFEYDRGEVKRHKIDLRNPRGAMYAAYAICRFKDGSEKCDVMGKDEIDAIRKRSRASGSGPWVTDYNEMAKKTVFRRVSKWLPFSPEIRDAIEADDDQYAFEGQIQSTASRSSRLTDKLMPEPIDDHRPTQEELPEPPQDAPPDHFADADQMIVALSERNRIEMPWAEKKAREQCDAMFGKPLGNATPDELSRVFTAMIS
jgi:recombination protein RecT